MKKLRVDTDWKHFSPLFGKNRGWGKIKYFGAGDKNLSSAEYAILIKTISQWLDKMPFLRLF